MYYNWYDWTVCQGKLILVPLSFDAMVFAVGSSYISASPYISSTSKIYSYKHIQMIISHTLYINVCNDNLYTNIFVAICL